MDLTASFVFIHNQSQVPLEGRTHRDQNLQSPTSSVSQLWSDPSPTPRQQRACLLNKQLCCWLGVSIAALRRFYLVWSAATYPGSFTTPMQCQLIAVTSWNIEQLLTSLNLWASPALCIWGQYVRRSYLMSEEKRWLWYICTAVKSHFLQTKQTNPFHSPPAGATTLLDVRTMCYFFLASVSLIPCQANVLLSYSAKQEISPSKATRCLLNQESVIGQVSVKTAGVQYVLIY